MPKSPAESLWMLLATFLMACGSVLVKYASADYHFWEVTLWRSFVGMVFAFFVLRAKGLSIFSSCPGLHLKRTVSGTISALTSVLAISLLPLGTAQACGGMAALFIGAALVARAVRLREKPEWGLLGTLVGGFGGIVLILDPSFSSDMFLGVASGILSSASGALAYWTISDLGNRGEPGTRIVFWFMTGGVLSGIVGGIAFGFSPCKFMPFLAMLGAGVIFVIMQMAMTRAWARGHLLVTGTLQFSNIVFSTVFGILIFGDIITPRTAAGIAIVMACGICATLLRLSRNSN